MKVILFGATGMVGQGALREALADPEVERVLAVGRSPTGQQHEKLAELVHKGLLDYTAVEAALTGYDACLFCLGVTSSGMTEEAYTRITHDIAVAAGPTLARLNPGMTFVFVSGAGADSTGKSRTMWARVKGKAENALLKLPFKAVYVFRPAGIQPLDGITSRTRSYRIALAQTGWLFPVLRLLMPNQITTTRILGRAMLKAAKTGAPKTVLESGDINALVA
jgi:uncharacterized protein YbjT (DUF2867 family)